MIKLATVAFVLAALMGTYMATRHFQKKSIPWALPIIHGLLAGTGLALLGTGLFSDAVSTVAWLAFGMFLLAAMGGVIVFQAYLRHQRLSSGMIIIHAMVAAMGLLFLIAFLYARGVVRESRWAQPLKVACGAQAQGRGRQDAARQMGLTASTGNAGDSAGGGSSRLLSGRFQRHCP
jgi:hypothetical protein